MYAGGIIGNSDSAMDICGSMLQTIASLHFKQARIFLQFEPTQESKFKLEVKSSLES